MRGGSLSSKSMSMLYLGVKILSMLWNVVFGWMQFVHSVWMLYLGVKFLPMLCGVQKWEGAPFLQGQCECCIWVNEICPFCVNVVFGCKIFVHAVWRSKMRGGSREEKCNSKRCHQLLPSHQSMCLGHFLQNIILQNITFLLILKILKI